jgi:hypothetical protein
VRFKTSIDFGGLGPSEALIKPLVGINLATMDRFLRAIDAVARGGDPEPVLAALEA